VRAITGGFTTQVDADRLSVATALAAGAPTDNAAALAAKAANLQIPVAATLQPVGARPLEIISYYAPAMAMFFVFFGVPFGARSFFTERREGTLDRIVAAPVPAAAVLLGKALSVFAYALVSLLTVAVVTSLAFGARWGGPLPVVILCVAISTAVVALTAFVIGVSRTDRQAEGFAAIVVFGLALLGGNFIFMSTAPPFLRRLALATPNGWALRGFTDLATGLGAHAVVEPVVAILVFSFVVGGIAALFAPRAVAR
jgi:ABC-2 type transport system permease protein